MALTIPSPLADAILEAHDAHEAWYAAFMSGDRDLTRKKLAEYQAAAQRRLELTPSPSAR